MPAAVIVVAQSVSRVDVSAEFWAVYKLAAAIQPSLSATIEDTAAVSTASVLADSGKVSAHELPCECSRIDLEIFFHITSCL